ncbi:hypothetical protein DYD21_01640 [Rhodohalobacter sp. SW132]|uniref:hypothetical protein n=1 Tax=Rhodohalobacter sp. SW132 TaxID=2293433 RepID=UPI000E252C38|nr:hypothetical protein [Rhodohalobacter sp. SW132]REL38678.1 hypothetical protein DYD21_01640 [Rhodohalobacter sp. SW132]
MINNQLLSAGNSKTSDLLTGQAGGEKQKSEEKAEGGLFKFLMGSIQLADKDGGQDENTGKNFASGRILGGNLITGKNESDDASLKDILTGLEKNSNDELSTISELLENAMKSSVSEEELNENGSKLKSEENADHSTDVKTGDEKSDVKAESDQNKKIPLAEDTPFYRGDSEKVENLKEPDANEVLKESDANGEESDTKGSAEENSLSLDTDNSENQSDEITDGEFEEGGIEFVSESDETEETGDDSQAATDDEPQAAAGDDPQVKISPEMASDAGVEKKETYETNHVASGETSGNENGNVAASQGDAERVVAGNVKREAEAPAENRRAEQTVRAERDSGLVNQLRGGILGGAFSETQPNNDSKKIDLDTDENELIQKMFADLANGNIDQQAAEVRSIKANQLREIRNQNYRAAFAGRPEAALNSGAQTAAGSGVMAGSDPGKLNMVSVTGMVPESSQVSAELPDEDAVAMWKEHIAEYFESKEKSSADQAAAFSRLNLETVTNISVRRNFATSLGQSILKATGDGKKAAEAWQKHTFTLENGKNIQLSAREVDGVLQIKLSSSSSELQKLLMDHQDEIRKHLEDEVNITIDLQLDTQSDGQMTGLFGGSDGNEQQGSQIFDYENGKTEEQQVDEVVPKAVRKFGYNQMEWSA